MGDRVTQHHDDEQGTAVLSLEGNRLGSIKIDAVTGHITITTAGFQASHSASVRIQSQRELHDAKAFFRAALRLLESSAWGCGEEVEVAE